MWFKWKLVLFLVPLVLVLTSGKDFQWSIVESNHESGIKFRNYGNVYPLNAVSLQFDINYQQLNDEIKDHVLNVENVYEEVIKNFTTHHAFHNTVNLLDNLKTRANSVQEQFDNAYLRYGTDIFMPDAPQDLMRDKRSALIAALIFAIVTLVVSTTTVVAVTVDMHNRLAATNDRVTEVEQQNDYLQTALSKVGVILSDVDKNLAIGTVGSSSIVKTETLQAGVQDFEDHLQSLSRGYLPEGIISLAKMEDELKILQTSVQKIDYKLAISNVREMYQLFARYTLGEDKMLR